MFTSTLINLLLSSTLISAAALKPRLLSADEVIVYSNTGRVEVMKKADYIALSALPSRPVDFVQTNGTLFNSTETAPASKNKRCTSKSVVYQDPAQYFQNWDVPMSSVVSAKNSPATVAVTAGYEISNSLSVSAGADFSIVKDILSVSYSVDYSQSWTSTYSAQYTFEIPVGKYGAVVSNPTTTRRSGKVYKGCLGEQHLSSTFSGDSYSSRAFGGMSWVDGVISLCTGDNFPLMRCIGEGRL